VYRCRFALAKPATLRLLINYGKKLAKHAIQGTFGWPQLSWQVLHVSHMYISAVKAVVNNDGFWRHLRALLISPDCVELQACHQLLPFLLWLDVALHDLVATSAARTAF